MAQEMVVDSGVITHEEDNSWRFAETPGGVVSVTIDPTLFVPSDEGKKKKYLTGLSADATTVWIRSGTPLAKVTSGANMGEYGPYDKDSSSDGRNAAIAGLLESDVELTITLSGVKAAQTNVGMRYRGDIVVNNMAMKDDVADAVWGGDFYDIEVPEVKPLSQTAAAAGAASMMSTTTVSSK